MWCGVVWCGGDERKYQNFAGEEVRNRIEALRLGDDSGEVMEGVDIIV